MKEPRSGFATGTALPVRRGLAVIALLVGGEGAGLAQSVGDARDGSPPARVQQVAGKSRPRNDDSSFSAFERRALAGQGVPQRTPAAPPREKRKTR